MSFPFGSVCSGMETAGQAWEELGATLEFVSEIEAFPCGVLGYRFGATAPRVRLDPATMPTPAEAETWELNNKELDRMAKRGAFGDRVANLGDFTTINVEEWKHVRWLVGGPPCQAFSIAGARQGLKDHRGNLTLAYVGLVHELASTGSLRGAVYENVPGLLSDKGNAFGCFLGALVGHDAPIVSPHRKGRWTDVGVVSGPIARAAWRVLDAQYFGLPQRRRRLFVVICFGDGPDPVEILFERRGMRGAPPPRPGSRQDVATTISARTKGGGGLGTDVELDGACIPVELSPTLGAGGNSRNPLDEPLIPIATYPIVADALRGEGIALTAGADAEGRVRLRNPGLGIGDDGDPSGTLQAGAPPAVAIAYGITSDAIDRSGEAASGDAGGRSGLGIVEELAQTIKARGPGAVAYSVMPMNSGKDFKARLTEVSQPLMAGGPVGGNQGGDYIVQPVAFGNVGHAEYAEYAMALRASGGDFGGGSETVIAFNSREDLVSSTEVFGTLGGSLPQAQAVAFSLRGRDGETQIEPEEGDISPALRTGGGGSDKSFVAATVDAIRWAVRRLMPIECERLQGVPDNFTRVPWRGKTAEFCPDGPRYKIIGNSMAKAVMKWLGERIIAAEERASS